MTGGKRSILVIAMSAAGVLFILLGLAGLALPQAQEGARLWQVDTQHAVHLMDLVGIFAVGIGLTLTWLGGKYWNQQVLA
jgi:hypothetical protein